MAAPSGWLTEELVDMGHEVTLFASGDSTTNAALVACSSRSLRLDPGNHDPLLAYSTMLARLAELASRFDVVHSHLDWLHIPLLRQLSVPFVTTLHGRIDLPQLDGCFERCFGDALYVSISDAQRIPLPNAQWAERSTTAYPRIL